MRYICIFCLFAFAVASASLSQESQGLALLQKIGEASLLKYVDAIEEGLPHTKLDGNKVPKQLWQQDFAGCGVREVKCMADGLMIVLRVDQRYEEGVFVSFQTAEEPHEGSGVSCSKISDRIYWLTEKTRRLGGSAVEVLSVFL